jgi:hypothetical protein
MAGNRAQAEHVVGSALRTCAALGLNRMLIDEGPLMIRLAKDAYAASEGNLADAVTSASVSDFVLSL